MLISHFASASGGLPYPRLPRAGPHHVNPSIVKSWVRLWIERSSPWQWHDRPTIPHPPNYVFILIAFSFLSFSIYPVNCRGLALAHVTIFKTR